MALNKSVLLLQSQGWAGLGIDPGTRPYRAQWPHRLYQGRRPRFFLHHSNHNYYRILLIPYYHDIITIIFDHVTLP